MTKPIGRPIGGRHWAIMPVGPRAAVPPCFDSREQYAAWRTVAEYETPGKHGYCADCTPEYQARMIRERRCSFPGALFVTDDDGSVRGIRPPKGGFED